MWLQILHFHCPCLVGHSGGLPICHLVSVHAGTTTIAVEVLWVALLLTWPPYRDCWFRFRKILFISLVVFRGMLFFLGLIPFLGLFAKLFRANGKARLQMIRLMFLRPRASCRKSLFFTLFSSMRRLGISSKSSLEYQRNFVIQVHHVGKNRVRTFWGQMLSYKWCTVLFCIGAQPQGFQIRTYKRERDPLLWPSSTSTRPWSHVWDPHMLLPIKTTSRIDR